LFAIFAVLCGALAAASYFLPSDVEGGWVAAACVAVAACAFAVHFARQLRAVAQGAPDERSNPPVNADARDVPPSATGSGARAGYRAR
jgi:hypothetical protein